MLPVYPVDYPPEYPKEYNHRLGIVKRGELISKHKEPRRDTEREEYRVAVSFQFSIQIDIRFCKYK